ncbi:MAG: ZIP family metal transporter [Lachnospiraceae bacterium]|nr:ZIP family metal transporter [Lachnospiraceae bacterium]
MDINTFYGIMIPFLGTALGSAAVFVMKKELNKKVEKALTAFAAGVMTAASVWSLLIPAMDSSTHLGKLAFLPAVLGFWAGTIFLLGLDKLIPHLHRFADEAEGPRSNLARTTMMVLAVTIHNIPEGMAVGVVFAGALTGSSSLTLSAAIALSLGIAIQNFPEGAIISMPLHSEGKSKTWAFAAGALSGAVEPIAALVTILFSGLLVPIMPFLLSFAAGAMFYVVVEELIPEMSAGEHSNIGVVVYSFGFTLMMMLDVALG